METVKGFRDIEASKRSIIRRIIEDILKKYNFQAFETPIIEYEEFVKGDNQDDEAVSDTFKLEDKGKRKLALRYEFTFQLKRLANNKKFPFRRYQIGEVFRDEPVSGNRFRQFTQCDADIVGSSLKDEAEVLSVVSDIFDKLKIKFLININNRKLLNEILEEQKIKDKDKQNVIKEIDKLDKLEEKEIRANLKKYNAESLIAIFKKPESYFKKYKSYSEIEELRKYCNMYKARFNFQPSLARGLSYYNGSVFEIKTKEIKETIAAGGSYLVNGVQSTGISFGLDRIEMLAGIKVENKKILIISIEQDKKAIELADDIRKKSNISCSIMYGKISKALDYANSLKIPHVIFLGQEEAKKGKLKLRDMKTGKEKMISEKALIEELKG
ncbi:MAG: ATP phosphoribosyltransferase regulatory subunit [Candidatus Nanoarchaeia archaeon]|nr:ATP phosphoribosyltransferase regulatory subunit [Candidatus Nanoarchaeia archaeon]MDD5741641.1 ATP phosphoribosyltransferase regulatory subunit [Candidatus Nanoarchaeia archaeon]